MTDVRDQIETLRREIAGVARDCGRDPDTVRLMAVSKTQTSERIGAALAAGQILFGENRVQEAALHWDGLRARWPEVELHLIGPLQSNKVKDAVRLFDCIETVDRAGLVEPLARAMEKQGRAVPCLIQVNTGNEAQKAGVAPGGLADLLALCRDHGLGVDGLMCIPPPDEPPALHFALLKKLADRHGLRQLSMGMSGDFKKAIPLGATIVRIGTAIFGARPVAAETDEPA